MWFEITGGPDDCWIEDDDLTMLACVCIRIHKEASISLN